MTDRPTRVLLADVPGAGRRAIAALLRSLPDVVLAAEVGSADELARERPRTAPDVVVIDDRLLAAAGPALRHADVSVIVMGLDDDPSYAAPRATPGRDGLDRQGARRRAAARRARSRTASALDATAVARTDRLTLRKSRNVAAGSPRCASPPFGRAWSHG